MSRPVENVLEFDELRQIVRRYTTCAPGRRAVEQLTFSTNSAALQAIFALIGEAIAWLHAGHDLGFGSLADPVGWLQRLYTPGSVLSAQELLDAASLLDTAAALKQTFRSEQKEVPLLAARAAELADLRPLAASIRRAILPNGEISDDASAELRRIRAAIARTRDKTQKTLRDILRGRGAEAGEDYITLRNDRFVIPVHAAHRRHPAVRDGVVHGASATGQTLFVEPLAAVELNNKLVALAEEEAAEIARILRELTERLEAELGTLEHIASSVAELDSVFARARFAREFNGTLPQFTATQQIRLQTARHPVLEDNLRGQNRAIVPMTLALGGQETVLLISGPNTGGKTVALKTIGLAALAAQSGIPVAAERAELPLFDRVLADIGDEQSITADLSTFSAHMLNLRAMLEAATQRSLVLVDEMGTGTAPEEGSALAVGLLEEFCGRRCLVFATTHHDRLKTYASTTPGVLNAAVEFDEVNLRPTYRLLVGVPGTSSGIEIARRLGLPAPIIERARAELSPEARESRNLIAYLHRSRDELEEIKGRAAAELARLEDERRKLQSEWAERQRKRLAELEHEFAETLKRYEQEMNRLVGDIKDRELRAQLGKQAARRVARVRSEAREEKDAAVVQHLAASQQDLGSAASPGRPEPVAPERLIPGVQVRVRGLGQPVVLRRLDEGSAEVQAGPLRMSVALGEIVAIVDANADALPEAQHRPPAVTVHAAAVAAPVGDEINVIGCRLEEATRRVDKFLDQAALAGKARIRVIHGHGTGALRRGLAEFLAGHPLVERISAEEPDRGGSAVTVVELRR